MTTKNPKKSRFQPIFDYMDERLASIEADLAVVKQTLHLSVAHIDESNRRWEIHNKRWELNDRRFNRQMEALENHHHRISLLENKT